MALALLGVISGCSAPLVNLDDVPEGMYFELTCRGYSLDADWGPADTTPLSCAHEVGWDLIGVGGRGPIPSESGNVDQLSVSLCRWSEGDGVLWAGNNRIVAQDETGCFPEPLWFATFSPKDRRAADPSLTLPANEEQQADCAMHYRVADNEFVARFECPWMYGSGDDPAVDEPYILSNGSVRCDLTTDQ